MRQRPPGAAAPFVSSQQQQFPETISPMPVRPSHNHVRNLTPPTPEPTTGLVPYIPRSERARNAGGGGGAPWT
ncbi:hypothetical protein EXIGLDRAFT_722778 [Exidia glandulosa HHB12029]|uniref:Uncharacterized protein n=1 Tax=Exidia glandulosa HHB12029 TaxID=1314781 RepID=A0A165F5B0_EXIGL|nr:hypothetical protein EXIGLDRAFT_722778 [Exidia glandulosa HHB12029]